VETFTPVSGISAANQKRVLINLHGGGFETGARSVGRVESIPIAGLGRIKVISVDYRLGPENSFPAATEDVAAVYRALLKDYAARNIGIYGCSAGGMLTAQFTAWAIEQRMPLPGAIGMLCGTGELFGLGDSAYFAAALTRGLSEEARAHPQTSQEIIAYLRKADPQSALVFPMRHPEIYRWFPPSLLISGTRSFEMSTVIDAHNKLSRVGVTSDLHIWDGQYHGFLMDADFPESREAYETIVSFFDQHLGRDPLASAVD
jgi:acetyl esterase/lipase